MTRDEVTELITRARSGDRVALDALLRRVEGRITALAHARLGDSLRSRVQTSDLVQSTFLEIVRSVDKFPGRDEEDFVRWAGRVLRNTILDKRRFFSARKRGGASPQEADQAVAMAVPGAGPSPSALATFGEDVTHLSRAFSRLPEDYRRVIELMLLEGRSTPEAAAELDRSEVAVRVLLCRARAALALESDRGRSARSTDFSPRRETPGGH